jgi:hypothetical protein
MIDLGNAAPSLWSRVDRHGCAAAWRTNPDALCHALDQGEPPSWDDVMRDVVCSGSLDCVEVLYDRGYEQHRSPDPWLHPAVISVWARRLEILRFVVEWSGPPRADKLDGAAAVGGGVEMLKYVRELGCVFDEKATEAAAYRGDLEVLRYLHMIEAPWDFRTPGAAVLADSLPCLEYAHMHGCPQEFKQVSPGRFHVFRPDSLPVLQYVCEHMDPEFRSRILKHMIIYLVGRLDSRRYFPTEPWDEGLDWPMVLYLVRKLGLASPKILTEARARHMERAAALAGVFWKAGKQLRAEETRLRPREAASGEEDGIITQGDAERMAMWAATARVPKELLERIAVEAHLILL